MITFSPIWAITLRHLQLIKRDLNLLAGIIYWPLLDVITWGFLGSWIQESGLSLFHNYELVALLGVLLWQVAGRGANVISIALCEELWQNNILNLFSLPLRISEWILGVILYFSIIMAATFFCGMLCTYVLYSVPLLQVLSNFLIFFPPLFFSGIWLGFICLQIIVLLGKRGVQLGFIAIWFLLPFSGAYYPIEVLPKWGQILSAFFPMSYVFTGMRAYVMHGKNPTSYLLKGYVMGIAYAIGAILVFIYLFNRSKRKGLARLMD